MQLCRQIRKEKALAMKGNEHCFFKLTLLGCYKSSSINEHIRSRLPTLYLHYMPITWMLSVNGEPPKAISPFRWTHRLVEMGKFIVYQPNDRHKVPIYIFIGFDHRKMAKPKGEAEHKNSKGNVYVYCSGRLIEKSGDTRVTLGLPASGSNYQAGVTVIIDERRNAGKLLQPNPSKEHVQELHRSLSQFPEIKKFVSCYWNYWLNVWKNSPGVTSAHGKMREMIWKAGVKGAKFSDPAKGKQLDIREYKLSEFPPFKNRNGNWVKRNDTAYVHGSDVGKPLERKQAKKKNKKVKKKQLEAASSEESTSSSSTSSSEEEILEDLIDFPGNANNQNTAKGRKKDTVSKKRKRSSPAQTTLAKRLEKLEAENKTLKKEFDAKVAQHRKEIYTIIKRENSLKARLQHALQACDQKDTIMRRNKLLVKRKLEHIDDFLTEVIEIEDLEDIDDVRQMAKQLKESESAIGGDEGEKKQQSSNGKFEELNTGSTSFSSEPVEPSLFSKPSARSSFAIAMLPELDDK